MFFDSTVTEKNMRATLVICLMVSCTLSFAGHLGVDHSPFSRFSPGSKKIQIASDSSLPDELLIACATPVR